MNIKHGYIMSKIKIKYIIFYDNNQAFMSIPTFSNKINKYKLLKDRNLDNTVKIKLEKKDKFIGW
jgi:hypothetical protein